MRWVKNTGFTIVEVLIVLAIAGVIMLVVFLTVPALERDSRNTQRRADVLHLAGLFREWSGNHLGQSPTTYGASTSPQCAISTTNEQFAIMTNPAGCSAITTPYSAPTPTMDTFFVYSWTACSNNVVSGGTSFGNLTIVYYVEPGTTFQCLQV